MGVCVHTSMWPSALFQHDNMEAIVNWNRNLILTYNLIILFVLFVLNYTKQYA